MEGPHEVDPSGDVIITLHNPGAPFAEAATEAEPAVEESPAIATQAPAIEEGPTEKAPAIVADEAGFEVQPTVNLRKKKKEKKKKRGAVAVREEVATEAGPAIAAEESAEEAPAVVAEDAATDAESVEAEHATDLDNLLEDGSREQGKDLFLSEPSEIQMRVSSRHLILASPYFKAALDGPWREAASVSADCCRYIHADGWDPQAFLILMHIIHGRNRQVPRLVSLELLAKIAVLVDYYKCYEAVEVFAALWLQEMKSESQLPTQVSRELVLWLSISWVFDDADVFKSVTSTALQQSQGPLPTLGLPIPERIVDAIDRRRQEVVDKIITALHGLLVSFRDGPDQCSFECSSILLGALMKEMRAKRFELRPEAPMLGYSVVATMAAARSIRSPQWAKPSSKRSGYASHSCDLGSLIRSKVDDLEKMMGGLTLDEFGGCRSLGHPRVT